MSLNPVVDIITFTIIYNDAVYHQYLAAVKVTETQRQDVVNVYKPWSHHQVSQICDSMMMFKWDKK